MDAAQLLALARELYGSLPPTAQQLTIGTASFALTEEFSPAVTASLPEACRTIEETVFNELGNKPPLSGV